MCSNIVAKIYYISQKEKTKNVMVLTNQLKFCGTLLEEDHTPDNSALVLKDVKIWRIKDICTCQEPDCKCDEETFIKMDWLHINVSKIVAFSLKK